jgi:hypothetical protein
MEVKMRENVLKFGVLITLVVSTFFLISCEKQVTSSTEVNLQNGLTAQQIQWIGWKPEIEKHFATLSKSWRTFQVITPAAGGVVGGDYTLGNKVEIPAGAVKYNTLVSVEVVRTPEGGAAVEFLPNMNFQKDVTITLSYKDINLTEQEVYDRIFKIYFSEDNTTWYQLDPGTIEINPENKTISFKINHFTRYGWGF